MTKVLIDKYPLGTLPDQRTPGRYMDDFLRSNIDVLAKNIVNDMQFLGLFASSTFEVRTGKSTLIQQFGEYYIDSVNRQHGLNLTFDMKNIVFNIEEFIERAFELPKYSVLILDENDEVDEHYASELSVRLRKFLKKAGQLNLCMLVITPDFFQMKKGLAVQRSNFLVDVQFRGEFERGYFSFYSHDKKRELYIKGKKEYNWKLVRPSFSGRFTKGYAVDKDQYLEAKKKDLEDSEKEDKKDKRMERLARLIIYNLEVNKLTRQQISEITKMPITTINDYITLGNGLK